MVVNLKVAIPKCILQSLKSTKRNSGHIERSFLDLLISIEDNKLNMNLFDKRDGDAEY